MSSEPHTRARSISSGCPHGESPTLCGRSEPSPCRAGNHRLSYSPARDSSSRRRVVGTALAMAVPQVVIVGRPNVGKSSLLNWLAGQRISIVDDQAGVTRDRVTHLMEHNGRFFELVDTGGIGIEDADNLTQAGRGADRRGPRNGRRRAVRRRYADRHCCRSMRKSPAGCGTSTSRSSASPTRPTTSSSISQADEFYKLGRGKLMQGQHACRTAASRSCST